VSHKSAGFYIIIFFKKEKRGLIMKRIWLGYVSPLLAGILVLAVNVWPAPPTFPDKPLEFVVQVAAGGSSDIFVRFIVKMLVEQKLVSVPLRINNQPGGGGAIANNYLKGKEGSPYYLLHSSSAFITATFRDPTVPGYRDFTPIACMASEVTSAVVRSDSPYKTIKDLVDKAKKGKPGDINWGATGAGGFYHLSFVSLGDLSGTKFTHVSFTGTNEVIAAILGGHIEVGSMQPSAAKPLVDAGRLRILAVSSEKRLSSFPNFQTYKEQGFDVVLSFTRGFVGPGKIPDYAKTNLSGILEKLSQSSKWKDYIAKEGSELAFLPADEYKEFLVNEEAKYGYLMRKAGIIK
jgi:putative tricarboxylic transport membrane protein